MEIIDGTIIFFSDFVHSEIHKAIETMTDIRNPAYTYIFLWIFIRIYRKITFNK
jgi:hypothetical protein